VRRRSSLLALAEEYLAFRRKLGFALRIEGEELLRFAGYAEDIGHRGPITTELAVRWAKLPRGANPLYWARRLDIVRRFAKHRHLFDPANEIPPEGMLGPSYRRPRPYIYSEKEISALVQAASRLGPSGCLTPGSYATLLGLIASTGLRLSEAVRLKRKEADLDAGLLTVTASKFHKSRLVPLHPSTTEALTRYAKHRVRHHPAVDSQAFFLTQQGKALSEPTVRATFASLRRSLGWIGRDGRPPRIHDLRHTFAVRRLLLWYEEGADIDYKIAALSTYLGHVKVSDTYWYLSATPELMAVTSARFEHHKRRFQDPP
jgi:integrase